MRVQVPAIGFLILHWCSSMFAQGYLGFDNIVGTPPAPVSITAAAGMFNPVGGPPGAYIGSNYTASLFFLDGVVTNHTLFDGSNPMLFALADTQFYGQTGGIDTGYDPAGYFEGGIVYLSAATNRIVTVQIRAWYNGNGTYSSYAQSLAAGQNVGESNPVEVILAIGLQNPTPLDGLEPFTVGIPEPCVARLLVLFGACWCWTLSRVRRTARTKNAPCFFEGR